MKITRRTKLLIIALALCLTTMIGSTFAWFTDSAESAVNTITAGNLDMKVSYKPYGASEDEWNEVTKETKIFADDALYEPGYTEAVWLKIENEGNLAFRYQTALNILLETQGTNKAGQQFSLSDYLVVKSANVTDVEGWEKFYTTRASLDNFAFNEIALNSKNVVITPNGVAYPEGNDNSTSYVLVVLQMPTTVGNEANHNGKNIPKIMLGLNVNATQLPYEADSFGTDYDAEATYPTPGKVAVTPDVLAETDFTQEGQTFEFTGNFESVNISELGEDSVLKFNNATIGALTLSDDAAMTGKATITSISVARNSSEEPIEVTLENAELDVAGGVSVTNTDGKSILNIKNSDIECATIYVGEHVNNHRAALAEFNVTNSRISCEENNLGSTISVWGRAGVKATIYDSEIYTYSRGWHQSEDANDNAITFQGAASLDVDIQRSNMHLYGARSIINVRQYGSEVTTINTNMEDSLIWVVTKSNHGEKTIPVWGFNDATIKDSILLFTKNVHQSTDAVFNSFVYGNPVIHGDYHVTTQCQWDAPIELAAGQTVTFASDANVSIYEEAGAVSFTGEGSVLKQSGAVVTNIGGIQ